MFRDAHPALLLVPLLSVISAFPPSSAAQDPIRVESNQVLVPVVVLDDKVYSQLRKAQWEARRNNSHLMDSLVIHGLTPKDFRLFEDSQQQQVQSVTHESPGFAVVHDNFGKHPETIGNGGGRWSYPDRPASDRSEWLAWPKYVVAYVPPPSPVGSCHQIQVKVNRSHVLVWARSEYCNTKHPPSDPLNGTEFGKQMESDLASTKESWTALAVRTASFYDDSGQGRVYVGLEFPWKSLKYEFRNGTMYASIGTLLLVYNPDGSLAARFSDFACCDYGNGIKTPSRGESSEIRSNGLIPTRYETLIDLPPGSYELRAILSDGENFGRKRIPFTVDPYDGKQLVLSDIALSRRVRKLPAELSDHAAKIPGSYSPLVSKDVEFTPAADAHFKKDELLYAYFELHDPQLATGSATTAKALMRVLDAKTGDLKLYFEPVSAAPYAKSGSSLVPIGRGLDLSTLPDGLYWLEVQATDSTGKRTAWRKANFVVEPAGAPDSNIVLPPAPQPTEVTLNLRAFDDHGNLVTDLTTADFQVFDGDTSQTVTALMLMAAQPNTNPDAPPSMTYKLVYLSQTPNVNFDHLRVVCTRKNVRIELQQGYFDTHP